MMMYAITFRFEKPCLIYIRALITQCNNKLTMEIQKSPTLVRIIQITTEGINTGLSGSILPNRITTKFFITFLGISFIVIGVS